MALLGEVTVLLALVPTCANGSEPVLCFVEVTMRALELLVISEAL